MKVTKPDDIYAHCSQSQGIIYHVLFGWFEICKSWGKRHTFSLEKQWKKNEIQTKAFMLSHKICIYYIFAICNYSR